jgi:hypothetical protein
MFKQYYIFCLFFILTGASVHAQGTKNPSLALKEKISNAKTDNDALRATLELIDFYELTNLVKWKQSILSLHSNKSRYTAVKSQQLIELIYSEYLLKTGNTSQFKSNFSKKMTNVRFDSKELSFRLDRLRFELEFLNKQWGVAKQLTDSNLIKLRGSRNTQNDRIK